jgi:S-DNA-T family DNA segregation ATPase FtsK/SpoIIIE
VLIFITIFSILTFYILFSTIFLKHHNLDGSKSDLLGSFGITIGEFNLKIFGLLGYFIPLITLFFLYLIYRNRYENQKVKDISLAYLFFTLSLIVFQSGLSKENGGALSIAIYRSFVNYFGKIAIWIAWEILFSIALFFINRITKFGIIKLLYDNPISHYMDNLVIKILQLEPDVEIKRARGVSKKNVTSNSMITKDIAFKTTEKKSTSATKSPKKGAVDKKEPKKEGIVHRKVTKTVKNRSIVEDKKRALEDKSRKKVRAKRFTLPKLELLSNPPKSEARLTTNELEREVFRLTRKLKYFEIVGEVTNIHIGPLVTTFEFKLARNIGVSKILTLQKNLATSLNVKSVRVTQSPTEKGVIEIEIPNLKPQQISIREILSTATFKKAKSNLTLAVGKDSLGKPFLVDLKELPNLFITGVAGSGKSTGIRGMILSLLFKNSPKDLRLLLIDPRALEFSLYRDTPNLLTPIINEQKSADIALKNLIKEMERRSLTIAKAGVSNFEEYNIKVGTRKRLPYIVVIIDPFTDLTLKGSLNSRKSIENSIIRLSEMARVSGIYLIVSTDRLSTKFVRGAVKANFPSKLCYRVNQRSESRAILGEGGAEVLLERGDTLFLKSKDNPLIRVHTPYISDREVSAVASFLRSQRRVEYQMWYLENNSNSKS